jgi:1-acyl-sn-glycerol-3-phosphate acyltransferase
MLLISPIIFISSFFGVKGTNFNYKVVNLWGKSWFYLIGIRHKIIYDKPHNKNKQYVFISNHKSYMDAPTIALSINQPFRVLGQYETSTIPLLGYIWKTCVITVKRNESGSRVESIRRLKSEISKGISIFLFPEGKFNDTENVLCDFFDGAFRIAIETQTPIKPMLLLDTEKRLHHSSLFGLTSGINRTVYLDEISVEGLTIKDTKTLKEKVFSVMEEKLIKYGSPPS